jgi:hypothetical protein
MIDSGKRNTFEADNAVGNDALDLARFNLNDVAGAERNQRCRSE